METKCTCEPGHYCPDDNLHYPGYQCEYCYKQELEMQEAFAEHEQMIADLEYWSGNKVKRLKPKPKHRVPAPMWAGDDELPF